MNIIVISFFVIYSCVSSFDYHNFIICVYIRICFIVLEKMEGEDNSWNDNGNVNNNGEENVFDQLTQTLVVLLNQQ